MTTLRNWILAAVAGIVMASPAFAGGGRGVMPRPTPAAPPGFAYVWVAPVYRAVTDQTWIPESTQLVGTWMETSPGHMEYVYRQITTPGHYQTTTRQLLVSDGHWQLVQVSPPPIYVNPPIVVSPPIIIRNPGSVGVDGYAPAQSEDLSKFSSLSEWPK